MPLGIQAVACHVPDSRLDLGEAAARWALTPEFLSEKTGFLRLARAPAGESALDLAWRAWENLQRETGFDPSSAQLVVFVTQTPGRPIPHLSAQLQARLGTAPVCLALDISHGCSGYVYGLAVALSLMKEQGLTRGLLFTADPYSRILDPGDKDTALLFGDAASATLLSDEPRWECGRFSFHTDGSRAESLALRDGRLKMDGQQVFQYAATQVPREIARTLQLNGLSTEEIDAFLLHSGSRFIVDAIAQRAGLPSGKVPFAPADVGNTVSSSIPLLLAGRSHERNLLLAGFGVGLSCATTVLRSRV